MSRSFSYDESQRTSTWKARVRATARARARVSPNPNPILTPTPTLTKTELCRSPWESAYEEELNVFAAAIHDGDELPSKAGADEALRAVVHGIVPLNMGALMLSVLGLMMVILGIKSVGLKIV